MSCLEYKRCLAWNTGDVLRGARDALLGTHGMSCLERTEFPAWNTRNALLGTHGMSCLEHKERPVWNTGNVLLGTHGVSCVEHKEVCYTSNDMVV